MFAAADQQAVAQPWFEEAVFIWFVDVHMAAKNYFNVFRMRQKDDQFWSDPNSCNVHVHFAQLQSQFEDFFWEEKLKLDSPFYINTTQSIDLSLFLKHYVIIFKQNTNLYRW